MLNILTRTHNRPEGFARLRASIQAQNVKEVNHLVSVETDEDLKYVQEAENCASIRVTTLPKLSENHAPYNLHINELLKHVLPGWIMVIDDDDYLSSGVNLQNIIKYAHDPDTMNVFQMQMPDGELIPSEEELTQYPEPGRIGSPCVLFHSKYATRFIWDEWKESDYRAICSLYDCIPRLIVVPKVVVKVGQIGNGTSTDIEKN